MQVITLQYITFQGPMDPEFKKRAWCTFEVYHTLLRHTTTNEILSLAKILNISFLGPKVPELQKMVVAALLNYATPF